MTKILIATNKWQLLIMATSKTIIIDCWLIIIKYYYKLKLKLIILIKIMKIYYCWQKIKLKMLLTLGWQTF